MNPVIGLDVSKGESQVQAFLDKGKPYELKAAANRNPFEKTLYQSHILSLSIFINIILQYKEHLCIRIW